MPIHELARRYEWRPSERAARRAYPALRQYLDSGDARANREAALAYRGVLSQDSHDQHAQTALAFLYAAGPDLNYPESESYRYTRVSGYSRAAITGARMLAERVAADSSQWIAAVALTRMGLAVPDSGRLRQALTAVRHALTADSNHIALLLALRDIYVLQQQYDSAIAVAERIPADCAPVLHARAEAMILSGDSAAGVRLYLFALEAAWPGELHRFAEDVNVTITRGQRAEYGATPPEERAAWLRAYWEHSAAANGRTIETRITDHLQRAAWANANDRSPTMPQSSDHAISWMTDTVHHAPWGARGMLYMRHGPPHHRYRAAFGRAEYEGWGYLVDEQPWTFVFARGEDESNVPDVSMETVLEGVASTTTESNRLEPRKQGWYLLPVAGCLNLTSFLGSFDSERLERRLATGEPLDIREMYVAMSAVDPRHGDMARYCTIAAAGVPHRPLSELTHFWTRENESTYPDRAWRASAVPAFRSQFRVATAAYEFRDASGSPEIIAMFWVPSADLAPATDTATRAIRLTYSLVDSIVGFARTDVTLPVPPTLTGTGLVSGSTVWQGDDVRSGTVRVIAVDAADTTRGDSAIQHLTLNGERESIAISDLVLAGPGAAGTLRRGSYNVSPLPGHAVEHGNDVRVFFELYGLEDQDPLRTSITIRPDRPRSIRESLGLADTGERTLSFATEASLDARSVAVQDFDLGSDLEPGAYIVDLTVHVRDRDLKRSTNLIVLPSTPTESP